MASGHSLGGALAQITAARYPVFQRLLTFQSPHVKGEDVDRLEAQSKLRARHYRMNADVVPLGGPQSRMAGEIVTFRDSNSLPGQHHTPMLSELLEQTRAEGGRLNAQQVALVESGKQPVNEVGHPNGNANRVNLQSVIAGRDDRVPASEALAGLFSPQNENVVANNLLFNITREMLRPDLEKLTPVNLRKNGGVPTLVARLGQMRDRIQQQVFLKALREREFSTQTKGILEAYGEAAALFGLTPEQLEDVLEVTAMQGGREHPRHKLLEVILWWKTGRASQPVQEIVLTNGLMAQQDLGRWWYAANLDGEDLYRALLETRATPRYL
ncbi:MAG: hypothetical protein HC933_15080 [Pleurocapsa sp. SU_196_0]|nr:hypothetical protein [Pleurocapsa sp. SU_196_0]